MSSFFIKKQVNIMVYNIGNKQLLNNHLYNILHVGGLTIKTN